MIWVVLIGLGLGVGGAAIVGSSGASTSDDNMSDNNDTSNDNDVADDVPERPFKSVNPRNKGIGVGWDYGPNDNYPGGMHYGMDQHGGDDDPPVVAPYPGRIVFVGYRSRGYGNAVIIDHGMVKKKGMPEAKRILTQIGHLRRFESQFGDTVKTGELIAIQGGRRGEPGAGSSLGPHTHTDVLEYIGSDNPTDEQLIHKDNLRHLDPIEWYDLPEPLYFVRAQMRKGRKHTWRP